MNAGSSPQQRRAARLGHDDEVPALRIAGRRRLNRDLDALIDDGVRDGAGEIETIAHTARGREV